MKEYARLLRIKHYIKNVLVFIPMFFGKELFNFDRLGRAALGFTCFCLISSAIYILNDIKDIEKDRMHATKKYRPLASGAISIRSAIIAMVFCIGFAGFISVYFKIPGVECLLIYFFLNVAYSMGIKNKPIIDVVILASGFVIRILYGGIVSDIEISKWLYLVIVTGSLYLGLGKRRNELKEQKETREVLKYYNEAFLDKNMYVCVALTDSFYALWASG